MITPATLLMGAEAAVLVVQEVKAALGGHMLTRGDRPAWQHAAELAGSIATAVVNGLVGAHGAADLIAQFESDLAARLSGVFAPVKIGPPPVPPVADPIPEALPVDPPVV